MTGNVSVPITPLSRPRVGIRSLRDLGAVVMRHLGKATAVALLLLGATAAASAIAALLFSAVPIVRATRGGIAPMLKHVAAGASVPRLNAGRILMAAQVAISVPLLVGAALFLRTIYNLGHVELGFNPDQLLIFRLDPS